MTAGLGSRIGGIWKYGEATPTGPEFSDFLNLLGDSVRDNLTTVDDPTYGVIPRAIAGKASLYFSGVGFDTFPLGKTIVGIEKYAFAFSLANPVAGDSTQITGCVQGTGTQSSVSLKHIAPAPPANTWSIAWTATYIA